MFDTLPNAELQALMDQFSVPMFAVGRKSPEDTFRIVCINRAFEEAGQHGRDDMIGLQLDALLPSAEAHEVIRNFDSFARTRRNVRFVEKLTTGSDGAEWDTTLQFSTTPEGYDRLIGTALPVLQGRSSLSDRMAFEDIRYYAAMADLHIQNLLTACDLPAASEAEMHRTEMRVPNLHSICRSVQRTVADIKETVRKAQKRHEAHQLRLSLEREALAEQELVQGCDSHNTVTELSRMAPIPRAELS